MIFLFLNYTCMDTRHKVGRVKEIYGLLRGSLRSKVRLSYRRDFEISLCDDYNDEQDLLQWKVRILPRWRNGRFQSRGGDEQTV